MKPRPILAGALALLIFQTLPAANVAPVLSSVGKILFPGTSPNPTISAPSGALTLASGGSNQNLVLAPSGTGAVSWTGDALAAAKLGLNGVTDFSASGCNGALCVGSGGTINLDDTAILAWGGGASRPQIAGSKAATTMDFRNATAGYTFTGGKVGIGAAPTTYALEVTGQVDATTGFRSAGTQIIDTTGNVSARGAANTVYRCATAGALPVGALTITAASCGTTVDTGFRAN
jgi:hypothetical protein